ncbi:MAG: hypothetical protein ACRDTT_03080 [Pseudonocardiaceae bacterium]
MKTTQYLKLERRIAVGERGGILDRWRYGRALLDAKAGRRQLPHGMVADLIKAAERAGLTLSEREIRRRVQCAEAYDSEAKVGHAVADFGTWRDLAEAGFPPVEGRGYDPDELDAEGLTDAPDSWEQLQLDIPGLKEVISVRGRKVPLVRGEDGATVADVAAYVAMCEEKHDNFGKTVEQARQSLQTMRAGCDGDDTANAVKAWEAGIDADSDCDVAMSVMTP